MFKPLQRPYNYNINHANDNYKNLGYDYREKIFKKSVSRQLFANSESSKLLMEMQKMVYFLIEKVKLLKTRNLIAVDNDENRLN